MGHLLTPITRRLVPEWARRFPRHRARIDLDGSTVLVIADRRAATTVREHVTDLFPTPDDDQPPRAHVHVRQVPREHNSFRIHGPLSEPVTSGPSLDTDLIRLLGDVSLALDQGVLHVHGALLEVNGRGIMLVGASGSGKTTLTAQLILAGSSLRTDELITIHPDGRASGVRRPLLVRLPSAVPADAVAHAMHGRAVATADRIIIGSDHPVHGSSVTPRLVVLHRWGPAAACTSLRPVSRAQAVRKVLEQSFDAIRLDRHAFHSAVAAVDGAATVAVDYVDGADAAARLIETMSASSRAAVGAASERLVGPAEASAPAAALARDLEVVLFDDSVLAYAPTTGALVEFARESADWWRAAFATGSVPADTPADLLQALALASIIDESTAQPEGST
jgi:hypothetical protein